MYFHAEFGGLLKMSKEMKFDRQKAIKNFFALLNYDPNFQTGTTLEKKLLPNFSLAGDSTLENIVSLLQPDAILEFGSWLGRSANNLLAKAPKHTILVAVDTFLGSYEHYLNLSPNVEFSRDEMLLKNGRPQLYEQFRENMNILGLQSQVYPFAGTTETFFKTFSSLQISFPLIFVDAAHDYDSVYSDLNYALKLLPVGGDGLIVGDDYESWDSVRHAVNYFADEFSLPLIFGENRYIFYTLTNPDLSEKIKNICMNLHGWQLRRPSEVGLNFSQKAYARLQAANIDLQIEIDQIKNSHSWRLVKHYSKWKKFAVRYLRFLARK